jgi:predicted nucleic acid-binding protein
MVIVDSSVWVDYLNDVSNEQTDWLERALGRVPVGLTSLILCEVLQGIRHDRNFRRTLEQLLKFPVFEGFRTELAVLSAQHFRSLQRRGLTVRKTADCIIASFCIYGRHKLLHKDRDFDVFAAHLGLDVVDTNRDPQESNLP